MLVGILLEIRKSFFGSRTNFRGGSRAAAKSINYYHKKHFNYRLKPFNYHFKYQPLTIITKRSILDVAAALDPSPYLARLCLVTKGNFSVLGKCEKCDASWDVTKALDSSPNLAKFKNPYLPQGWEQSVEQSPLDHQRIWHWDAWYMWSCNWGF